MHHYLLKGKRYLLVLAFTFFLSNLLFAQQMVTGKITDNNGMAVAGVSVREKGTTTGTSTNGAGEYKILVKSAKAVLVFSYIGTPTQEIEVGSQASIDVKTTPNPSALNEVIVVGYGTQSKKEITSAITSIKAEQFNKGNVSDVAQLLQGKVAGLSIAKPGGDPNGGFAIRLRGLSTLGANASPLTVVDGQVGIDINTVDPNDIASIDVLKDAASAAIYGTRGAAGVIIITTKRGSRGATVVTYNGTVSAETPVRFTKHVEAADYKAAGGTDLGAKTDWNKAITRTAVAHTHNLSLSGGNGGTSYSASLNYRNNEGVAITTGFQQLNAHFGLTQKALNDKLVFTIDMTSTKRDAQLGWNDAFKYATIFNPTAPIHSADSAGIGGNVTGSSYYEQNFVDYANPVAVLRQNTNNRTVKRNNINASATYEIIPGLKFLVRYATENIDINNWVYLPINSFYVRSFLGVSGFARHGYGWKQDDQSTNKLYENTLAYDGRINKLKIAAIAGYSYQDFLNKELLAKGGNFLTDAASEDLASAQDFIDGKGFTDSYKNGSKLIAFFGRLNLNYNDVAFLSASLRREGSTQFGVNNKWGMFPAVSAGLDINKLVHINKVNALKLRGSYGITGALPSGPYLSQQLIGPTGSLFYYNGNYVNSYGPTQNANPDLKWERKAEFDAGLDFAAFNNRLTGTVDYYNRTTSDLIFNVTVSVPPNPTSLKYLNIGTLKSSGFELLLGYDVVKNRAFTWNTAVNFSTYHVKLSSLNKDLAGSFVGATNLGTPGQEQTQITRAVEGQDIGLLWGPVYRGLDKDGKYQFDDGKGGLTKSIDYKTKIGNGLPEFELGWANTFHYNKFDLNFFFRGSFGHNLINTYRAFYENPNIIGSYNVVKTKYYDPNITDGQIFSSLFVENASFVKLDNATVGYNFEMPKAGSVKSIRVFLTGQNLFTITGYTGVDPEVRYDDDRNILAPGVDRRETWVRTRTITLGANIRF